MSRLVCVMAVSFVLYGSAAPTAVGRPQAGITKRTAEWERLARGSYENKGVARIERLGQRWILSVWCRGIHSTYLDGPTVDLNRYLDLFVTVQYNYVDREVADPKCVRAPCSPLHERRISIERITPLQMTLEEARNRDRGCE